MSSFPIDQIRARFPAIRDGGPIFFDNPGGTQVPQSVIDAVADYWRDSCANVGGAFETSRRTDAVVLGARSAMADLLGAIDPAEIVFGASMTALTLHLARSFGETLAPGDEILVTALDHDANVAPWLGLESRGAVVRTVPFDPKTGTLDLAEVEARLRPGKTKLLALTAASNALGTIPDVREATRLAHAVGALVYVDGVQSVPHVPTDVQSLGCDFLACSAYKFFGPHVGVLWGKREPLERLTPSKVRPSKDTIPYRWEQGTLNHEGLAGVGAAVGYLESLGSGETRRERLADAMEAIQRYESALCARLLAGLAAIPDIAVYGPGEAGRVPTVAFTWPRHAPRATCELLAKRGLCAWSGNYYAVGAMEALGLPEGAVRLGLSHYNTLAEVEFLLETLTEL